jgi:hypothetical protein
MMKIPTIGYCIYILAIIITMFKKKPAVGWATLNFLTIN